MVPFLAIYFDCQADTKEPTNTQGAKTILAFNVASELIGPTFVAKIDSANEALRFIKLEFNVRRKRFQHRHWHWVGQTGGLKRCSGHRKGCSLDRPMEAIWHLIQDIVSIKFGPQISLDNDLLAQKAYDIDPGIFVLRPIFHTINSPPRSDTLSMGC